MEVANIDSCILKFKVTCLKFIGNFLYAGIGGNLLIFEADGRSYKFREEIRNVLPNSIYGVQPDHENKSIAVYGNKKISVVPCYLYKVTETSVWEAKEWIWCIQWMTDECLAIVTGLNELELLNWSNKTVLKRIACEEKCILYSAHIIGCKWDELIVLAGTVYTEILVWAPRFAADSSASVIHRLRGHNGVIFSVNFDNSTRRICSTSDDRTVRIWNVIHANCTCPADCYLTFSQWTRESIIEPHVTIFGHSARVWRGCLMENGRVLSIGEDSLLCVWDENGKNIMRQETHQGGRLCCLEIDEDRGVAVTGGADGGVSLWCIDGDKEQICRVVLPDREPTRLLVLETGSAFIISRSGCLTECNKYSPLFQDKRFINYCLSEVSPCNRLISLCSIAGDVLILEDKIETEGTLQIVVDKKLCEQKIFSSQWLGPTYLLCCGSEGNLIVSELRKIGDETCLDPFENFILPTCRERWVTCAFLQKPYLICGTRNGSIHVYQFSLNNKNPVQSFHKLHGRLGVTSFLCSGQNLLSTGRDGSLRMFCFSKCINNAIEQVCVDKLPFAWAAKIIETKMAGVLVIGFLQKDLIVWSQRSRIIIWRFNCFGGHREWKCFVKSNLLHFYFIKDKVLFSLKKPLEDIVSSILLDGFHTREINSLKLLPISDSLTMMVSAGEDNVARVSFVLSMQRLVSSVVLTGHLSSLRTVALLPLHPNKLILFTAGGRAQLKAWLLHFQVNDAGEPSVLKSVELGSHMLNNENDTKRPLKSISPRLDPETRYMDITVRESCHNKRRSIIYSACSDGYLRIFEFSLEDNKFSLISSIFHQRCLLKTGYLNYKNSEFVITTTTDGFVYFWNVCDKKQVLAHHLFESGVNSFDIVNVTEDKFLLAAGGDNCKVSVDLISFEDSNRPVASSMWSSCELHCSQVSGIKLKDDLLFTAGVDQRLNILKWKMTDENLLQVDLLRQYRTYVPDVHGISIVGTSQDFFTVCVYGVGVEILRVTTKNGTGIEDGHICNLTSR